MLSKAQENYNLAKKIIKFQRKLRRKNPENSLLNMIGFNDMIMFWTDDFEKRYRGRSFDEKFNQYLEDLKNSGEIEKINEFSYIKSSF